ncbi:MAG: DUF3300 domain-containing protein, partial [Thermodesulfobacteriota bacterium]
VTGKALEDAMQQQKWDPSVKSLTAFPQVLQMMDEKLDWTTQLGDAFLAQQKDVLDAVQVLRQKAQAEGNLESNDRQTVVVEQQPSGSQPQTIVIQPASPEVVYVPTYNPTVVYGAWPYPSYPPYYYYPPGYAAAASIVSFGVGMAVGSALWGDCNWGGGDVDIDVNRYNEFNRTSVRDNNWSHDPEHRRGAQYRDQASRERYGGASRQQTQAREQFRGRAERGRQDIARGDADRFKGGQGDRVGQARGGGDRQRAGGADGRTATRQSSAFSGAGRGSEVRREADRGRASRERASSWSGGGRSGGGGYQRSSGGGGRGGGRGGGGRGGRR